MFDVLKKCSCNNYEIIFLNLSPEYMLPFAQTFIKMGSKICQIKLFLRKKYPF